MECTIRRMQYKNVIIFFCIAFFLPFISVYLQTLTKSPIMKFILYGIEAAAPSIATIIIIVKNRIFKSFFIENFKTKTIIRAILLPVVIAFMTMFLSKIIACFLLKERFVLYNIPITQAIIILWAFVAEELGWRGYLQPLLDKQMKQSHLVPFVVGIIWCIWHYHYFLFGDMQVPFVWFFIGCIVESYIYSYLLALSNNNLLSAMIYHFTYNLFIHVFAINPIDNSGNSMPYIILVVFETLLIFGIFAVVKRKERVG